MWQQAGSASGFKNYVACELPQLLGTISDSTSVMQSLFSISLQVLQFCLADSSCVLQQWGTQFLLTFPSCYNTEQLSVFLQSMNAQHTYINRYCMYENLHLCIFLELESALWFHYPDFYIIHCLISNVSICIHLHTNTCVCQNLFFCWGFWQLSPCCGDFTKVGCVELETVGRGESQISSCRMRTDTLLLMRSNKSWTTWKNPCDSGADDSDGFLLWCICSAEMFKCLKLHNCRWSIQ